MATHVAPANAPHRSRLQSCVRPVGAVRVPHYRSAQQRRFPEPFVREIEERFGDCLDTDHSAGRGNGMSGIVAGKQPNEAERVHRGERARHDAVLTADRTCERSRIVRVPCRTRRCMKAKWKISPIPQFPQSQPTTTTPIWPFSSSRAYRWPRSALRTPRTLRLCPPTNARFHCLKVTPAGFPLPPETPGKETQFSHCVNRG